MSETSKQRHHTRKYCYRDDGEPGCGVDVASQGDSVVPWAIALDLPPAEFAAYCGGAAPHGPIQLRGHADKLPFDDASLDFLYSSHWIEDRKQSDWPRILAEWKRVIKVGGYMIVLVPERSRWEEYLRNGGCPNCSHAGPEPSVGDISKAALQLPGLVIIEERLTDSYPGDFSILFVARKVA